MNAYPIKPNFRLRLFVIGLIVAIIPLGSSIAKAQLITEHSGFCRPDLKVRDYLRTVTRLSGGHPGSKTFELPFGPGSLKLTRPKMALVVIGHDGFGLTGSSHPSKKALRWWVTSRLLRVDIHGRILKEVKEQRRYIPRVAEFKQSFGIDDRAGRVDPGLYKLEVSFENIDGETLGTYHEFYRAVEPRSELGLRIFSHSIEAGSYGYLRVENGGTVKTTYSFDFRLWRLEGEKRIPVPLPPYIISDILPAVRPGYAGPCFTFHVPEEAPAGDYEVGIWVRNRLFDERQSVVASFHVS